MQTTTVAGRVRHWYRKAKDSAFGTDFADHVMGGYKFLMQYYTCEDDLYFFGFSRGAYTARFLANMLDHVGLLSAGNEELIRFAWKTYAKWASRRNDESEQARKAEYELYAFIRGFRETFCRPVRRIRFLGLFDTVNSVPEFDAAWMLESKFPYTVRTSAKVIRHAVSIDERRAKFRQDLISDDQTQKEDKMSSYIHRYDSDPADMEIRDSQSPSQGRHGLAAEDLEPRFREPADAHREEDGNTSRDPPENRGNHFLGLPKELTTLTPNDSSGAPNEHNLSEANSKQEQSHRVRPAKLRRRQYAESGKKQDIEEVWFPGGHSDIGGGWCRSGNETWMLSHVPLVWMVHEAIQAGLEFDPG